MESKEKCPNNQNVTTDFTARTVLFSLENDFVIYIFLWVQTNSIRWTSTAPRDISHLLSHYKTTSRRSGTISQPPSIVIVKVVLPEKYLVGSRRIIENESLAPGRVKISENVSRCDYYYNAIVTVDEMRFREGRRSVTVGTTDPQT